MDFGKLSDTFRGLAGHLDGVVTKGIGFAETGIKVEGMAVNFAKMFQVMLEGMAAVLEVSPVTIPGPKIPTPTH